MANFICDGPVTKELLQKVLQEFFKTEATMEKCEGAVISEGTGFTSDVLRVQLEWNGITEKEKLPTSVVVKAPMAKRIESMNQKLRIGKEPEEAPDAKVPMIHKAECGAYRVLGQANPCPIPIPIIYAIRESDPSMIVMEYLSDRANLVDTMATGLTLGQWKSVTVHLAHLHAWSLTTDVNWKASVLTSEELLEMLNGLVDVTQKGLKPAMEKFPEYFGHIDESIFEKEISYESFKGNVEFYRKFMPDVMMHGDTGINNIMFLRDPKNPNQLTDKVAAFIDWQISAVGCGLQDLARLTCWCVPHKLRQSHTDEILKTYFDEFSSKAGEALDTSVTLECVKTVFSHAMASYGLFGIPLTDFIVTFMIKADKDPTGWRKSELLGRMKAAYDEAEEYFRHRHKNSMKGL